jgi:putative PIN family toxin of toxin-antitoxin system
LRIILDTNVLISGIFFKGPPYQILSAWRDGYFDLIVSEEIFAEYLEVCKRLNEKYPTIEIQGILDLIAVNAHFYQPIEIKTQITADPDDDKFIECALAADVKIIISGDQHLLDVNGYLGLEVIKPIDFIDNYI